MNNTTPEPSLPAAAPSPRAGSDRRKSLIAAGVGLTVVVLIFGFVLPSVIDYDTVFEVLGALEFSDYVIMVAGGAFLFVPEGALYASLMPGMSLRRGMAASVGSTAVATTIPGADLVVRFGMYRSWGHTVDRTMLGVVMSGLFDNIVKLSLPSLAVILVAFSGQDLGDFAWFGVIAIAVLVLGTIVITGMVRSERFTQWLAERTEALANWGLGRIKRDPVDGLADQVVGFRDLAVGVVKERGLVALTLSASAKLWSFVVLVVALRTVGLDSSALTLGQIFVGWVAVLLITAIPITPGGIGIAEVAYIWIFGQMAGQDFNEIIAAGVVLFRLATWFLPIPIGWVAVGLWRRQISRGDLPDPFAAAAPSGNASAT